MKRETTAKPQRTKARQPRKAHAGTIAPAWQLRLYVAGKTQRAVAALENLREVCETHLKGQYSIELIDLLKNPQLARGDQILAVPALVRKLPEPVKKIIGDLSKTERLLVGLDIRSPS